MLLYADFAVQAAQTGRRTGHLGLAYLRLAVEYLAVQVADAHHIVVYQSEGAYAHAYQILRNWRAQSTHAHKQHTGLCHTCLPRCPYFRQP